MAQNNEIELLFRRNYAAMHSLASMMLHDADAAHDVVHDIFASLMEKGRDATDGYTLEDTTPAFLLRCVRNSCLNRLRFLSVRERFAGLYFPDDAFDNGEEPWPDEETYARMETCIDALPQRCREVFTLRFREGLASTQIEERLGIGERAVYKHLRHAIDTLRSKLIRDGKN